MPGRARAGRRIGTYSVDHDFFRTMGIELLAGRLFDESRPMDDSTTPFPEEPEAERALVARGVNIVINELAAKRMGFADPAEAVGKQFKAALFDEEYGLVPDRRSSAWSSDSRFRSIREPIDPIMFRINTDRLRPDAGPLRQRAIRRGCATAIERVWKRHRPRRAVRRRVQRGHRRRALRGRGGAGEDLRRLRAARRGRRLPRPVRPRRLHRRAADQGDRHPQGARRAQPRHRPAARLAILQAGDRRQPHRLAGRLVGDARLAERLRRPDRLGADAVRARRRCSRWPSRSAPSPATPSASPAPTRSTRSGTNRNPSSCGAII